MRMQNVPTLLVTLNAPVTVMKDIVETGSLVLVSKMHLIHIIIIKPFPSFYAFVSM